jgi:soluble lytic murein transglycosylase-like protein
MAGRIRTWQFVAAVVVLIVVAGCGLTGKHQQAEAAPVASTEAEPSSEAPTTDPPTEAPSPTPSKTTKPATKPAKPAATGPTADPFWDQLPACAHFDKTTPASKSKVKAALKTASARIYWKTEAPTLKLNYPLVKAVAWQESGWTSNIHNCDGGAGVMQVMPDTVTMVNNRFGLSYDVSKLQDNADAGANYLAWLTRYVGLNHFAKSQDLSASKCKTTTSWCLLNAVISGYNAGPGAIDAAAASKTLPNPAYVGAVRALMTRCQCDQY